ncbi:MAG: VCBS repeat-containing protein [Planctomycetes bacterium]|nr:VCBS repeat-containing protein [Planctomycetota bacterium]
MQWNGDRQRRWHRGLILGSVVLAGAGAALADEAAQSTNRRYRVVLNVDPHGILRSHCPVTVDLDFKQALVDWGAAGTFDEHTIEVVGYAQTGELVVYDAGRPGYEKNLLPWRIQKYWGLDKVTLSFVMPSHNCTTYAVRFDTVESGVGQPDRYHGLVGDGDWFVQGYERREINACHFDAFCDFDGDGDLDLFKGGVESFIYCWENVGGNRFVDRGRMTSGNGLLNLPRAASNRSWLTVAFFDFGGDGDQDLFASFQDGPYSGQVAFFENTTAAGGLITFADRGPIRTPSGGSLFRGQWFAAPTIVTDWDGDGDGHLDVIVGTNNRCYLFRNLRPSGTGGLTTDEPVTIQANGTEIVLTNPRFDAADIDGDGDRDLFAGSQEGPVWFFENVDTTTPRTQPTFAAGRVIAFADPYYISDAHSGVKVADFTGDGRPDFVVGRYWERTRRDYPEDPREYGWMYENVGPPSAPQFVKRDASNGAPYTLQFQNCDAIRQNGVRACDWNNDSRLDLIAGDTDGHVWYFRNVANNLYPVFATGEKLRAAGQVLSLMGSGGHARPSVYDWNNDGRKDLVVADGEGWVTWFRNSGTDAAPVLDAGQRLSAGGALIDRGGRSSVLVCDYNGDGKKDLVFADQDNGFVWFQNTGTDASPVLSAAKTISITLNPRPNLGSFVDWDGDGKKDLIACQFENDARFFRNTSTGQPGVTPTYASSTGVIIVQPYTSTMLVSGADALDFRGDGDIDILTGQGHGGSGLRFYERDYIESTLNNNAPTPTVLPKDSTPPGKVGQLQITTEPGRNTISWINPPDADYVGVMIRSRTDTFPADPEDGTFVGHELGPPGTGDSFVHSGLMGSGPVYYSLFAHDSWFNYSPAAGIAAVPLVAADFDRDEDVDQVDFGHMQACMGGPNTAVAPECQGADLDGDQDVDAADLAIFLLCFNGPDVAPRC